MAAYVIELCLGVNNEKFLLTESEKGFGTTTKQRSAQQYRTRDLATAVQEQLLRIFPKTMLGLIRKDPAHTAPVNISVKSVKDETTSRSKLYTFINQE